MSFRQSPPTNFPRVFAGRRRMLFVRLLLNGVGQAAVAFGLAYALRSSLASARLGVLDWPMVIAIAVVGLLFFVLRIWEAADAERLGQDYVMRVRLRLFKRIALRPVDAEGQRRWGVTMTRMISDLNSLRNWVAVGIARATVAGIMIIGLLGSLWVFSPQTGILALIMVLICFSASAGLTPLLRRYVRESRRRRGRLANNLGEKVFAFHTVRNFGNTRQELARVQSHSQRLRDALVRRIRISQVIRVLPQTVQPMIIAAVVVLTATSPSGLEELPVTILVLGILTGALAEITRGWDYRLAFDEARRRIGEVLDSPQITQAANATALTGTEPLSVELVDVQAGRSIGPLNFRASAGDIVRIVGPAGAGKTMVMLLIARFLDPDKGEILLGDQSIRHIQLDSLYQAVQFVTPELPLMRGTVADNLCYGIEVTDDDWLEVVADACGLQTDASLTEGLQSRVEEQAQNLPRSVRSRVALARAAVMRPRLLLIDDPTFISDKEASRALRRVVDLLHPTVLFASNEDDLPLPITQTWRIKEPSLPDDALDGCQPTHTLQTEKAPSVTKQRRHNA